MHELICDAEGTGSITRNSVRLGGCEQKHELSPQFQIWCQSSMDWVEVEGGIKLPDQGGISAR